MIRFDSFTGYFLQLDAMSDRPHDETSREQFLEAIIENIPDMIFVKDAKDLRFIRFNRAAEQLLGYQRDELIGKNDYDFFPKEEADFFTAKDRAVLDKGEMLDIADERIQTKAFGERILHTKKIPVVSEEGEPQYLLGISEDITEKKRLQARVAENDRMASVGLLAAGVAHEINNPLTFMLLNLRLVTDRLSKLENAPDAQVQVKNAAAKLEQVIDGAHRVKEIVRDLMTFSRAQPDTAGGPVEVNAVLDRVVNMAKNEIRYRAQLVKNYGDIPRVLGSEGRLAQVFLNLIINAAHAIEDGAPEDNEIRLKTYNDTQHLIVEVHDTGHGISQEHQQRVFDPFFTTKEPGSGCGLGLSICRNIVESIGGTINISSGQGGTAVAVHLPLDPALRDAHLTAETKRNPDEASGLLNLKRKARVLIVDDEPQIASSIGDLFGDAHEITQVSSGAEAQQALSNDQPFDLVVCDLMMPVMTGIDLYQWLNSRNDPTADRILFITGGAFTQRAQAFLRNVPNICLEKPFSPGALMRAARETLAHMQRIQPASAPH